MQQTPLKRKIITFERIIKTGFVNFVRNISLSVAATAVMVVTLTIVLFSVIANATFKHTLQEITSQIDISIYLKDEVTAEQRDALINQLKGLSNVREVSYSDKNEVLQNFVQANEDNPDLASAISLTDNPLPVTIRVKPVDPSKNEEIQSVTERPEIKALQAAETSYSGDRKDAIDKITAASTFVRQAVVVGIVVFAVISMLIIFNTIQMAIFNRRDELTIMRLLGASTWYIKGPFIVETMLYGVISAIVSLSLTHGLFTVMDQTFGATSLGILDINYATKYFNDNFFLFLAMQLVAGIAIGAISALIATRRYLKLKPTGGGRGRRSLRKK